MQQIEVSLIEDSSTVTLPRNEEDTTSPPPTSIHNKLNRVRKPRVHIDYAVSGLGAVAQQVVTLSIPAATALIGAWLQARFGRKVRVKVGDVEVEAATPQEVEKLLERAKAYRASAVEGQKSEEAQRK